MIWTIVIALFIWQGASALIDLLWTLIEESANKPAKIKRESKPLPLYDIMWGVIIVVLMIVIIAIKHF